MTIYRAEFSIAGVNAVDAVLFNLKSTGTDRLKLLLAAFFVEAATTNPPIFGLKRMNAVGTGVITVTPAMMNDAADGAPAGGLETAWATTRPTVVGGSGVRGAVPLAIGNGVFFDFRSAGGLVVPLSAGVCGVMRNASGATLGVLGGYVEWDE